MGICRYLSNVQFQIVSYDFDKPLLTFLWLSLLIEPCWKIFVNECLLNVLRHINKIALFLQELKILCWLRLNVHIHIPIQNNLGQLLVAFYLSELSVDIREVELPYVSKKVF